MLFPDSSTAHTLPRLSEKATFTSWHYFFLHFWPPPLPDQNYLRSFCCETPLSWRISNEIYSFDVFSWQNPLRVIRFRQTHYNPPSQSDFVLVFLRAAPHLLWRPFCVGPSHLLTLQTHVRGWSFVSIEPRPLGGHSVTQKRATPCSLIIDCIFWCCHFALCLTWHSNLWLRLRSCKTYSSSLSFEKPLEWSYPKRTHEDFTRGPICSLALSVVSNFLVCFSLLFCALYLKLLILMTLFPPLSLLPMVLITSLLCAGTTSTWTLTQTPCHSTKSSVHFLSKTFWENLPFWNVKCLSKNKCWNSSDCWTPTPKSFSTDVNPPSLSSKWETTEGKNYKIMKSQENRNHRRYLLCRCPLRSLSISFSSLILPPQLVLFLSPALLFIQTDLTKSFLHSILISLVASFVKRRSSNIPSVHP